MSRSKPSKLSAERKLVQRHRVVRVNEKNLVFDFLKFPLSNRKKNSRFARFQFLDWVGERCSVV